MCRDCVCCSRLILSVDVVLIESCWCCCQCVFSWIAVRWLGPVASSPRAAAAYNKQTTTSVSRATCIARSESTPVIRNHHDARFHRVRGKTATLSVYTLWYVAQQLWQANGQHNTCTPTSDVQVQPFQLLIRDTGRPAALTTLAATRHIRSTTTACSSQDERVGLDRHSEGG